MLRWIFNRRLWLALFWTLAALLVIVGINLVGVYFLGDVQTWTRWLKDQHAYFLLWRICLYAATAFGWWWMRERVRSREPDGESLLRLRRAEAAAVIAIVLLEGTALLQMA